MAVHILIRSANRGSSRAFDVRGRDPGPWAERLEPEPGDLELADRSLLDTVAVTLAARDHRVTRLAAGLPDGARWAVAGHVLDFDDLHMPSTTHISAVCVPTALATGGGRAPTWPRRG